LQGAFHFADTDLKPVTRALRAHEEGITQVLRATVPGLITSLAGEPGAGAQLTNGPDASEHRLLVRPDAFHVSVLFQPTLAFLERAAACLPEGVAEGVGGTGEGSLFLNDFVVRVYLPQLEEKVSNLFHQAAGGESIWGIRRCEVILMSLMGIRSGRVPGGYAFGEDIRAASGQGSLTFFFSQL
jgi:exocyst complex component 4